MISISKLMNHKRESSVAGIKPLIHVISATAIPTEFEKLAEFRRVLEEIALSISEDSSPEEIQTKIDRIARELEQYNASANAAAQAYRKELLDLISMMTNTIAVLGVSSQTGVQQLRTIEKNLESAATIDEVRLLRNKLSCCLVLVRNETVRAQFESQKLIKQLQSSVLRATTQVDPKADPTTGIPGSDAALETIQDLLTQKINFKIAIFMVMRLPALNARYGREAGDKALFTAATHLRSELSNFGKLFRWSGPAFVLISDEQQPGFSGFDRQAKEVGGASLTCEIHAGQPPTQLPFSWAIHNVGSKDSLEDLRRKLDAVLAAEGNLPG